MHHFLVHTNQYVNGNIANYYIDTQLMIYFIVWPQVFILIMTAYTEWPFKPATYHLSHCLTTKAQGIL